MYMTVGDLRSEMLSHTIDAIIIIIISNFGGESLNILQNEARDKICEVLTSVQQRFITSEGKTSLISSLS
jgi:hypothetical protein